ncbi:MAG: oligosaccharide flippase family protein [Actinomycetota bacterium]|nr:oligosaccharide flippase family protein [Actinomycetota bacterium]
MSSASRTFALNVGSLVWNFAVAVLLSRTLGTEGYGAYSYALALSLLLVVPAGLGLPMLVVRQVAAYQVRQQPSLVRGIIRRSLQATVCASAAVVVVAAVVAVTLVGSDDTVRRPLLVGLLFVPAAALYRLAEGVLRGFGQVVHGRIGETTVQPVLLIAAVVTLVALGTEVDAGAAMALTVVAGTVAAIVSWRFVSRKTPDVVRLAEPRHDLRSWSHSARPLLILNGAQTVQLQIGLVLLGLFGEVAESGIFHVALRLAGFVAFLQFAVIFPLAPAISQLHARGDREGLQRLLSGVVLVGTAFGVATAAGLLLFSEEVLGVFGPGFADGSTALLVLVVGELVNVVSGPAAVTLTMTNRERIVAASVSTSVVVNVGLAALLIPRFGLEGVAAARAATVAVTNGYLVWQLWRHEQLYAPALGRRLVRLVTRSGR